MILTKLEMTHFGKYKDVTVTPEAGYWEFVRPNESGKTTLADFIRFMFYGFVKSRSKLALRENLIVKYMPWDGGDLSGAVEFTADDGKSYRIERTCNEKGKGSVRVLNALREEMPIADVGGFFLGVDEDTFINVFYINQSNPTPRRTAQMDVALKNLVTTGNEEISFDTVEGRLNERKSAYTGLVRSNAGRLKKQGDAVIALHTQIYDLKMRLQASQAGLPSERELDARIAAVGTKIEALQKRDAALEAEAAMSRNQKREALRRKADELEAEIKDNQVLSEDAMIALQSALNEIHSAQTMVRAAEEDLAGAPQITPLDDRERTLLALPPQKAGNALPLWIAAGVCAAAGIGGLIWLWYVGAALLAVAVVCGALAIGKRKMPRVLTELGITSFAEYESTLAAAKAHSDSVAEQQKIEEQLRDKVELRRKNAAETEARFAPISERYGIYNAEQLASAREKAAARSSQNARLNDLRADLAELGPDEEVGDIAPIEPMEGTVQSARAEQAALLRQKAELADRLAKIRKDAEDLRGLQEQYDTQNAAWQRAKNEVEILDIALGELRAAQQELRDNYVPVLRRSIGDKIALFTDGKYDEVAIDADLNIRIKADGALRELGYFSDGTHDAVYLALRLSLAEIVEGDRHLPLIFDDPFVCIDRTRFDAIKKYLASLQNRQILMLSCRDL